MTLDDLVAAAERIRANAAATNPELVPLPLAGIGWATVEGDRAIRELDGGMALEGGAGPAEGWTELSRDASLGARVWRRGRADGLARPIVFVLEPDTEGRLAASLARFGEGVAVIYLGYGSLGRARIVRGGKPWGPNVVVLGEP